MATYTVKAGDSLSKISAALGITEWMDLYNLNKGLIGSDPNLIKPGQVLQLPSGIEPGSEDGGSDSTPGATTQALPKGAKLVKIGSTYRVIWDLGGGLGWAWYDITGQQLEEIYDTKTPAPHFTLSNTGQFESQYGNNYWGNVGEINLKADDPWQDLTDRIYNQFGYVPGFDTDEVRKLLTQAFFEDWDQNQWLVEYRNTDYYQSTTDVQRQWVGLSDAEKAQRIEEEAINLQNMYQGIWGYGFDFDDAAIQDMAFKIASGQSTLDQWEWDQRAAAAKVEGTVEWNTRRQQEEDLLAEGNEIENLTLFAEQQWLSWVGPVDVPAGFAEKWGSDLASGKASQADLETYLKDISNGRWSFKPPNLTWTDWASTYKQQIKSTLELGSLDDKDPLLNQILGSDLNGVDLNSMIRQDERFKSTQQMFGELSSMAEDMGRRFGFIT